ncbi:MAG: hypothetical protein EXX96DRAFT_538502 [Benjaminiella poitrasii]|nr:MAG: hypothetical protein EXX96DRAFT_538502 [Benjaminiella poitrasii]
MVAIKGTKSRAESNIQASYDRLQSRKICTNEGIMQYLNSFSSERTEIHNFMKSCCHRENKGYLFSNRKMAQDYITRVVLGRTKVGEDFKLAHSSSRRSRRKRRKQFRQQYREELHLNDDVRRTIVAYGVASVRDTYKGNTLIPVKQVQRAIAEKAIVIFTDEICTSVTCCHCYQRLVNVSWPMYIRNHRKKKHRSSFFWGKYD